MLNEINFLKNTNEIEMETLLNNTQQQLLQSSIRLGDVNALQSIVAIALQEKDVDQVGKSVSSAFRKVYQETGEKKDDVRKLLSLLHRLYKKQKFSVLHTYLEQLFFRIIVKEYAQLKTDKNAQQQMDRYLHDFNIVDKSRLEKIQVRRKSFRQQRDRKPDDNKPVATETHLKQLWGLLSNHPDGAGDLENMEKMETEFLKVLLKSSQKKHRSLEQRLSQVVYMRQTLRTLVCKLDMETRTKVLEKLVRVVRRFIRKNPWLMFVVHKHFPRSMYSTFSWINLLRLYLRPSEVNRLTRLLNKQLMEYTKSDSKKSIALRKKHGNELGIWEGQAWLPCTQDQTSRQPVPSTAFLRHKPIFHEQEQSFTQRL